MENKYPYTVLFIEDEKEIRDNYIEYLKLHFETVYEAEDGLEAYKIYKEKKPDIMIVDINVPKLSGLELMKKIRKSDHSTKIIVLTAYETKELLLQVATLKLTSYLIKPVTRNTLNDALVKVIDELSTFLTVSKTIVHLDKDTMWDIQNKQLLKNGVEIVLTKKENDLFHLLISNPSQTQFTENIMNSVWPVEANEGHDVLRTVVKNLRKKLPKNTIKNVFGLGYKVKL